MSKSYEKNIRDYIIKDKLGVGSYGTIYRVHKIGNSIKLLLRNFNCYI